MVWISGHVDTVNNVLAAQSVVDDLVLTDDMLKVINEITASLSQLRLAVTMLIEQDPPPVSVILPLLQRLFNSKLLVIEGDSTITQMIKNTVMEKLKSLYDTDSVMDLLKVATVLDPRFKSVQFLQQPHEAHDLVRKLALDLHLQGTVEQDTKVNIIPDLSDDIKVIIKDEPDEEPSIIVSVEEPSVKRQRTDEISIAPIIGDLNSSAMSIFFDDDGGGEETLTPEKTVDNELKRYLNEEKVPMVADPCEWWQTNANKYPLISVLAASHLCIPATARSPSQIYVRTCDDTFSRKRLSLAASHVDVQLFLYTNNK